MIMISKRHIHIVSSTSSIHPESEAFRSFYVWNQRFQLLPTKRLIIEQSRLDGDLVKVKLKVIYQYLYILYVWIYLAQPHRSVCEGVLINTCLNQCNQSYGTPCARWQHRVPQAPPKVHSLLIISA